jgi:hypothetical protein
VNREPASSQKASLQLKVNFKSTGNHILIELSRKCGGKGGLVLIGQVAIAKALSASASTSEHLLGSALNFSERAYIRISPSLM